MTYKNIVGLDCGNSSFRILLGKYDGNKLTTEVIDQIPNNMVRIGDYFYWDLLKIFDGLKTSLRKISKQVGKIDSIGVCTWGIDFALFDKSGNMIGNSLSYRNTFGGEYLEKLSKEQQRDVFQKTGIICDRINSVYLLSAIKEQMPDLYSIADKFLMIPDIINYFLTGVMLNEPSEFSTSQLMDVRTKKISTETCKKFGIDTKLFNEIGVHGKIIGNVRKNILEEIEIDYDIPVVCVPSHDTASAITAIPTQEDSFVFISSGTWSLIGTELDEPKINDETLNARLTNEVGAFDKITLLKNSAGMFIIQRIKQEYDAVMDRTSTWDELDELADLYQGDIPLFNVNDSRFFNPYKMSEEIWSYLVETNQVAGKLDWGTVIKSVHESMACSYATTIEDLENVLDKKFASIYIVGGGSKNIAVNNLTAKRTGKKVIACSKESTALGNIATQLKSFDESITLKKIREIIANSITVKEYTAEKDSDLVERYKKLL